MSVSLRPSLNWLLIFVPISLGLHFTPGWGDGVALFACSALAIVPLAGLVGCSTEELAEDMGEGVGALLNATFGNAAELIIGLVALSKGLTGVVKASISGSIIGNLLLVFGAAALAGGVKFREQTFNRTAARTSMTSLTLAAAALVIPTVFHFSAEARPSEWNLETEEKLSFGIALVLAATYVCVLIFSLRTHSQLFRGGSADGTARNQSNGMKRPRTHSVVILLVSTALVVLMSEFLVDTIQAARVGLGLSEVFVGVIVVAIVGNAAEHSTAIQAALKNKMDLSLGISVGSSLQIALFVAPILVFVSNLTGAPMTLEFSLPEVVSIAIAVQLVFQVSGDGETNWLEGVQLLSVYLVLAILFFYLPPVGG